MKIGDRVRIANPRLKAWNGEGVIIAVSAVPGAWTVRVIGVGDQPFWEIDLEVIECAEAESLSSS